MKNAWQAELRKLIIAVERTRSRTKLSVHAGHGLTYLNTHLVAAIPGLEELNIGHSIISKAVFTGLFRAVREMREIIKSAEKVD